MRQNERNDLNSVVIIRILPESDIIRAYLDENIIKLIPHRIYYFSD